MRVRLALLAIFAVIAACDDDERKPERAKRSVARRAVAPEPPPPPRPDPLPAGMVCCDARVRGDHLVQVASEETCARLEGSHAPIERCWLPDPPQLSGEGGEPAPAKQP